jgi:hypothetical protein
MSKYVGIIKPLCIQKYRLSDADGENLQRWIDFSRHARACPGKTTTIENFYAKIMDCRVKPDNDRRANAGNAGRR